MSSPSLAEPLIQVAAGAGLHVAGTPTRWANKLGWGVVSAVGVAFVLFFVRSGSSPKIQTECTCEAKGDPKNELCCDTHYATPGCKLLEGIVAQSLQVLLAVAGFTSLLLKKKLEESKTGIIRSYKVWGLDVAKQAASGACAHIMGIVNAKLLDEDSGGDECSWYFISFTLDTVSLNPHES
jgi:hypothetical protein